MRDPKDIKIALNAEECFDKPSLMYSLYFEYGMFVIGGDEYKLHRKTINPAFNIKSIQRYLPIMNMKMNELLQRFDSRLKPEAVEFGHYGADFTLDTILSTMFGIEHTSEGARLKLIEDFDR